MIWLRFSGGKVQKIKHDIITFSIKKHKRNVPCQVLVSYYFKSVIKKFYSVAKDLVFP